MRKDFFLRLIARREVTHTIISADGRSFSNKSNICGRNEVGALARSHCRLALCFRCGVRNLFIYTTSLFPFLDLEGVCLASRTGERDLQRERLDGSILWFLVVAHGPLHYGAIQDDRVDLRPEHLKHFAGRAYFLPNQLHQRRWKPFVADPMAICSTCGWCARLPTKTSSPGEGDLLNGNALDC